MSVSPISNSSTTALAQVQQTGHGHHSGRKAAMEAAAKALNMSSSDLQTALQNGQSLSSLAKSKGVSPADLSKDISSALTASNPSLSADQASSIAQRMIAGPSSGGSGTYGTGTAS